MKRFKYHFSFGNWNKNVPEQVATFQFYIKNLTSIGAIATYVSTEVRYAIIVAAVGYTFDFLGHFIYVEEINHGE